MPTLSFHAPEKLSRRLRKGAKAAKLPLSSYVVATIERGLVAEAPQQPYGFLKGVLDASAVDPAAPAFEPGDWKK